MLATHDVMSSFPSLSPNPLILLNFLFNFLFSCATLIFSLSFSSAAFLLMFCAGLCTKSCFFSSSPSPPPPPTSNGQPQLRSQLVSSFNAHALLEASFFSIFLIIRHLIVVIHLWPYLVSFLLFLLLCRFFFHLFHLTLLLNNLHFLHHFPARLLLLVVMVMMPPLSVTVPH